jgi:CO dehydrogenase maturation factor
MRNFSMGKKIAITGKGGAGKTMIASCLAGIYSDRGDKVYAIDADPNPTLGQALGFPEELLKNIQPLLSLRDLIRERTGAAADSLGSYFLLNPYVSDIPKKYSATYHSISLLIMGATRGANTGCACAENSLIKALLRHLVLEAAETVIVDMVAGTEHIGRGTAVSVDAFITVVEPSMRSIQAGRSILQLSKSIPGLKNWIVGNKIRSIDDEHLITNSFPQERIAGFLPWRDEIISAENSGEGVYHGVPEIVQKMQNMLNAIENDERC